MKNISIIKGIEYKNSDTWYVVKHRHASGSYTCKADITTQGRLYKHSLSFVITSITPETQLLVTALERCQVIRFCNINNNWVTLGGNFRLNVSCDQVEDGTPGNLIGYKITVEYNSLTRAPYTI